MAAVITCLLPARNAAADLPGWLESVARFADAVIALDDGSTDETRQILEASDLVTRVISNPPRDGYAGWDDASNRQRLLDAAVEAGAGWVLYLDADERIDADDAAALREFVPADVVPGCAYGLQVFRAWGDEVDPAATYAYRLFCAVPGLRLPERRLHFNPVPDDIPQSLWLRTTIRIRHLESGERLREREAKYAEADPERRFGGPGATQSRPPARLVPWTRRDTGAPVLAVGGEGERETLSSAAGRLTCLLPARNAAADLPGWLESVARFADAVIALDDGSTDETRQILEASDLVTRVISNPPRDGYAGWDDASNRQRLLDAAVEAGAGWVLYLDADERIDANDAAALVRLAKGSGESGCAYGFRVFRMIGDESHYDRAELWVYRMFFAEPGYELPCERLHLVPVPTAIPQAAWRKTTVRIKHLASLTAEARERRLRKYDEADPDRRWQRDYQSLVSTGSGLRPWVSRPRGLPVLADPARGGPAGELDLAVLDPGAPVLSAIVISRNDRQTILDTVGSVAGQECPVAFEVIVAASGSDGTADVVRNVFPSVKVVDVPEPGLPGMARNAGLAVARGEYISFPGSHTELPPGSLAARIAAHERGGSMVTGSILNGTPTRAGWAAYFLDHSGSLPGRPSGELGEAPAHCSYTREALLETTGFPEDMRAGEDTVVNRELWVRGHRAFRDKELELVHHNPSRTTWLLVRNHWTRGRALGAILIADRSRRASLAYLGRYPRWRMRRADTAVASWGGELKSAYRHARALIRLGILAACAGAAYESVVGNRRPGIASSAPAVTRYADHYGR